MGTHSPMLAYARAMEAMRSASVKRTAMMFYDGLTRSGHDQADARIAPIPWAQVVTGA